MRDPEHDCLDCKPGEALDQLIGASIHYRIAIGPNAGKKALALGNVPAQPHPSHQVTYKFKQPFRDGTTHASAIRSTSSPAWQPWFLVRDSISPAPEVIAEVLENIRTRDEAKPSQPRAPPLRTEHPDTGRPHYDRRGGSSLNVADVVARGYF